jgi:adenylosuccinate synthase
MVYKQSLVVIGTQWGDEGKGKVVDFYAEDFDYVVRCAGGDNAGHTVKLGKELYKFHLIPSGILHPDKISVLGNGMVINPVTLLGEIDSLEKRGHSVNNLVISDHAHAIMQWHKLLDGAKESLRKDKKIGTTQRGIGPAYQDKASRTEAIRIGDLLDKDVLKERIESIFPIKKLMFGVFGIDSDLSIENLIKEYTQYGKRLKPFVRKNIPYMLDRASNEGKRILFEGAQGTLLDVDHGTYPYVTSSNPTIGGVCTGTGVPTKRIDFVIGVVKAYTTRVGRGPLPTELGNIDLMEKELKHKDLVDEDFKKANAGNEYYKGKVLRKQGGEYGTTTGRPRRCGWFDAVVVNYAKIINGIDAIALTKLDVLSGLDELRICLSYEINGIETKEFPSDSKDLAMAKPVYKTFDGWKRMQNDEWLDVTKGKGELPAEAREYSDAIANITGIPICLISVGPERNATILIKDVFKD